jgi:hypothetical protein
MKNIRLKGEYANKLTIGRVAMERRRASARPSGKGMVKAFFGSVRAGFRERHSDPDVPGGWSPTKIVLGRAAYFGGRCLPLSPSTITPPRIAGCRGLRAVLVGCDTRQPLAMNPVWTLYSTLVPALCCGRSVRP